MHLFRMGSGQGGGQGGVKAVGASASASCPTAGSGGSRRGGIARVVRPSRWMGRRRGWTGV